jgi:hypothetical protein
MTIQYSRQTEDAIRDVRNIFTAFSGETREVAAMLTVATVCRLADSTVAVKAPPGEEASPMRTRG